MAGGHAYAASAPTFDDPVAGVDLTLYWGSNDGGENPAEWEQEVALGRFHKDQVDVNGFNGYGYQSTWRNDSYLRNVENLRSASHDQHAQLKGEPGGSQGMYFNGTADFINSGVIKNTNNNLGWEDNFMTLFTTTFTAPTTGNYQFKMDQKDDRHAMWIDLDQDGVFEGGSGTNGSASTNSGNELLNPNMSGSNPNVRIGPPTNIALTGGQQYLLAIAHWQGGGGAKIRPHIKIPGGSFVVMDPLDPAQDGYCHPQGFVRGRFLHEQGLTLEANGTNLVAGNTYYYRIKGTNSLWNGLGRLHCEFRIGKCSGHLHGYTSPLTPMALPHPGPRVREPQEPGRSLIVPTLIPVPIPSVTMLRSITSIDLILGMVWQSL